MHSAGSNNRRKGRRVGGWEEGCVDWNKKQVALLAKLCAGGCVLIWPNGKLRAITLSCMWQVRKGVARRKGFASRETSWTVARAKLQQPKRDAGGGLVAMASVTLTDNQLSHVWGKRRVPPAGCKYLQDIFQIIRKYAKIAAHAFRASAERPWRQRGEMWEVLWGLRLGRQRPF